MPFVVTGPGGEKFNTDDLTIGEAEAIEAATDESWLYINPFRSAKHCRAILVAFLSRTVSPAEAEAAVKGVSVKAALDGVERVDDDLPEVFEDGLPKAEGDTSTST